MEESKLAKTGTGGKKTDDERASDQPQTQTTSASPDFGEPSPSTAVKLLDLPQLQLDQMFNQLQFNQLQIILIFIQRTH